ncbi:MAG: Maf family protein [Ardenticatenaceae bacterium]|nr:Maf family protein [Ardenticatenaceae bacterium]
MSEHGTNSSLWLASASPRRHQLLSLLNLPFEVCTPNVSEQPLLSEPPAEMVKRLSRLKAQACAQHLDEGSVVAADTIVVLLGRVLGKPQNEAEAGAMLRALRGRRHLVLTGHTTLNAATGKTITDVCESKVTIRAMSDKEIEAYIASGDPLDKAAAYAVQNEEFQPASEVIGCPANVMGLPVCHIARDLYRHGVALPPSRPRQCRIGYGYLCAIVDEVMPGARVEGLAPPPPHVK